MIRLASASKSRADILREFGVEFIQGRSNFDEDSIVAKSPKEFVYRVALGKYQSAKDLFGIDIPLLVADTVVTANGKILRKAKSRIEARDILTLQSGNSTSIITCMIYESKELYFLDISTTDYIFREFDREDLELYLDSREWVGKAGACMVEGFCKKYIESVKGLESNAKGLGVEKLLPFIE